MKFDYWNQCLSPVFEDVKLSNILEQIKRLGQSTSYVVDKIRQ